MNRRKVAWFLAILAFFIFVGSPFSQIAKAIVGVDDALIAIIIAALAALGITFVTTGAYQSLRECVAGLMEDYATSQSTTVSMQLSGVQTGTNRLGQLLLNNRFVGYLQGFAAYIKYRFSLQDNDITTIVAQGASIGGITAYSLPLQFDRTNGNAIRVELYIGTYVYCAFPQLAGSVYYAYLFSEHPGSVTRLDINSNGQVVQTSELELTAYSNTGKYINTQIVLDESNYPILASYDKCSLSELQSYLNEDIDYNNIGIDIVTGDITLPYDDDGYSEGDGAILDVGADWGDTYTDVTQGVIPGAFSDSDIPATSINYEGEGEVQEQVQDTPAQTVSPEASEYQVLGLQNVFPFCIPFDIYAFFECLAADPVAPVVSWRFYVPGICDETITLDLSQFNTVAQIVRTMELLAFIVGLALVTREKFLRG